MTPLPAADFRPGGTTCKPAVLKTHSDAHATPTHVLDVSTHIHTLEK